MTTSNTQNPTDVVTPASRLPVIALVGRPNVGKSTLFNKMARRRIAIVEDMPGVTRDRIYADVNFDSMRFTIIDTGGIEPNPSTPIFAAVRQQSELAIEEADVIIFVVDARTGPLADDETISEKLRKSSRPIIIAANKADVSSKKLDIYSFYELGLGEVMGISAVHGIGLGDLLDAVVGLLPAPLKLAAEESYRRMYESEIDDDDHERLDSILDRAEDELFGPDELDQLEAPVPVDETDFDDADAYDIDYDALAEQEENAENDADQDDQDDQDDDADDDTEDADLDAQDELDQNDDLDVEIDENGEILYRDGDAAPDEDDGSAARDDLYDAKSWQNYVKDDDKRAAMLADADESDADKYDDKQDLLRRALSFGDAEDGEIIQQSGPAAKEAQVLMPDVLRIAVIGKPNAGKSSLINKLLGQERHLVSDVAGTTIDAIDSFLEYGGMRYRLIDTAGIRRKRSISMRMEQFSVVAALKGIDRCDVAVLLVDATAGITEQDMKIAAFAHDKGKALIIVINKWDVARAQGMDADVYTKQIRANVPFLSYAPIRYVSAKTGKRVFDVLDTAKVIARHYFTRHTTGTVNRVLQRAVGLHQPPMVNNRRTKLYFGTQASIAPPTFVFATNNPSGVHFSYRRYLTNQIRQALGIQGVPIRLIFKQRGQKTAARAANHAFRRQKQTRSHTKNKAIARNRQRNRHPSTKK